MPKRVNLQRWNRLCMALNISPDRHEFTALVSAYSQPERHYHTLQHLDECLEKLDWAIAESRDLNSDCFNLIEVALWYHDAIYQPRAKNNEQKSAEWATRFLSESGLNPNDVQLIQSLILATEHRLTPVEMMHQLMVDIDLSILGAEVDRFQEYDRQIRQEYAWVPRSSYREKRKEVLSFFLSKPRIYATDLFYRKFEKRARKNLKRAIENLNDD
ncbi:MAG: N-methyl-D-aspartate receptor NMDAR2C subunit [Cyanobacteriota bacterium]|nr:N-methyl-D-aspartate receptor NMDAR2C subunit [Cyanobacteriota bacterium]